MRRITPIEDGRSLKNDNRKTRLTTRDYVTPSSLKNDPAKPHYLELGFSTEGAPSFIFLQLQRVLHTSANRIF